MSEKQRQNPCTQTFSSIIKRETAKKELKERIIISRKPRIYFVTFKCLLCNENYNTSDINNKGVTICDSCKI